MNLANQRPWITPLVMGSFALSAVTGVLMIFHLDTGLNKTALAGLIASTIYPTRQRRRRLHGSAARRGRYLHPLRRAGHSR